MFNLVLGSIAHLSNLFASAGGGGSGGGGGAGIAGLAIVGYAPMHILGAQIRKAKKHEAEWVAGQIIAWVVTGIFTILLLALSHFIGIFAVIMAAGAIPGMGAGLYGWFSKLRQNKLVANKLSIAAQNDGFWNEQTILDNTKAIFLKYQTDWSNYNTESMKSYMTPSYQYHAALMIYALQLAGRRDFVDKPIIKQSTVMDASDSSDNSQDKVVVGFTASANDQLIDTTTNKVIFTDRNDFTEYWQFQRSGNAWLLYGIQPATASMQRYNPALQAFATAQGFFYSLDWGWLLLPSRGQLFGQGKFGISDINNHIIGMYKNCLIQMYSYNENPNSNKQYLIAQAYVPKNYGNIVVRHKSGLHPFGIRGLNKISMEWPDFNNKYEVFATDLEQATSFELLDPVYMEKLEALQFEVNIEVVDNVVYLYAPENRGENTAGRYESMLAVLQKAFEQMKL